MDNYEIVAFYKADKEEVRLHAEALKAKLHLDLRYEKLPLIPKSAKRLLSEKTVLALFGRSVMRFRRLLRYVYQVPAPVLLVDPSDALESYDSLKIPVGYLLENKEKVVWANFFRKQNDFICIELIIPAERDANIRDMVESNVRFMENVFHNSGTGYSKTYFENGIEELLKDTFRHTEAGVLFIMRPFRVFSFFIPPTLRFYKRYGHTQVLLIPRDDELYVPCH